MTLLNELRTAARNLLRAPTFTLAAILTLAVGIGANTAIVSVIDAVTFAPLPFRDDERLVVLGASFRSRRATASVTPADFQDYRGRAQSFESIGAAMTVTGRMTLTGSGEPEQIRTHLVTGNYFQMLGVAPLVGRGLLPEDDQVSRPAAVALAHAFWQRRFAGDPGVVGQRIILDGTPCLVVGVMPPGIEFPPVDAWAPLPFLDPELTSRSAHFLRPIGRLEPGIAIEAAQAELDVLSAALAREYPATNREWRVVARPVRDAMTGAAREPLQWLAIMVASVLLLVCANVSGLFLVRNNRRLKEIAVRLSLGATRGAIARLVVAEGLLIALCGALLAIGVLMATNNLITRAIPGIPAALVPDQIRLVVVALLTAIGAAVAVSVVPALQASRQTNASLTSRSRHASARLRRTHGALAVSQLAVALVLLSSTALLAFSLQKLLAVPVGVESRGVTTVRITLPRATYDTPAESRSFFNRLLERIEAAPGVQSASVIDTLPLGGVGSDNTFTIRERPAANPGKVTADARRVDARYFETVGIPLKQGRSFTRDEARSRAPVMIVSESFAAQFIPGESAIGKHVVSNKLEYEIVGVVADVRHRGLRQNPYQTFYVPAHDVTETTLVVRSGADEAVMARAIRDVVREIDSNVPVPAPQNMESIVAASVQRQRTTTLGLGAFAVIALLVAAIGIYGVIALSVTERTREIGIRAALGATAVDVRRLVLGQGIRITLIAIAVGVPLALAAARVSASLLFEVKPEDPAILIGVAALLASVAMAASYIPARRATRIDPALLLRAE